MLRYKKYYAALNQETTAERGSPDHNSVRMENATSTYLVTRNKTKGPRKEVDGDGNKEIGGKKRNGTQAKHVRNSCFYVAS